MTRVIGSLIYLSCCLTCLLFVSTPLALAAAGAGLGAGVVTALVAVVLVMGGNAEATVLTPAGIRNSLPGRVDHRFVRRDNAWPQYFAAQIVHDARGVIDCVRQWGVRMWSRSLAWLRAHRGSYMWWPLSMVPLFAALGAATVGMTAGVVVAVLVVAALAAVAWAVGVPVVYLLRGVDAAWRMVWRSRASCTACFATADVPTYRCAGNHTSAERAAGDDLHRDMRPGRLGVLWRRCACGTLLPTTVLRAAFSHRLQPCCPSCGGVLFPGAGVVRDVRAPVFGAASSGKTQLIMSALVGLHRAAQQAGVTVSLPDDQGRRAYAIYADLVARNAPAPKTDTTTPVAVSARIEQGVNTTLLHMFDAAGETMCDPDQNASLGYLDTAETLIFVLDPFSIRRIREEHGSASSAVFAEANAALHNPEDAYNATAQRLQDYGVPTRKRRLAFVVTKADLLGRLPLTLPPGDSASVREWLIGLGLDNLLLTASRDFREVRFFLCSGRDTGPDGPVAVLRWVLMKGWGSLG